MYNQKNTKKLVIAGLLLAIGLIIPSIFHLIGIPGTIFLPMHIPVILGGFLLPPVYAFLLGALTPFINSLITGMPIFFPIGLIMIVELASYGLIISLLAKKTKIPTMISLIISLILGRIIAGLFIYILSSLFIIELSPVIFITGAVMTGIPGIVIQLILVPVLVHSINRYTTINMEWD